MLQLQWWRTLASHYHCSSAGDKRRIHDCRGHVLLLALLPRPDTAVMRWTNRKMEIFYNFDWRMHFHIPCCCIFLLCCPQIAISCDVKGLSWMYGVSSFEHQYWHDTWPSQPGNNQRVFAPSVQIPGCTVDDIWSTSAWIFWDPFAGVYLSVIRPSIAAATIQDSTLARRSFVVLAPWPVEVSTQFRGSFHNIWRRRHLLAPMFES